MSRALRRAFLIPVLIFLALASSAQGVDPGKRATVADLERLLSKFGRRTENPAAAASEARPDTTVKARDDQMQVVEIEFLKLTERLTPWTRERLEKTYRLGPQGFDALERAADLSALQAPPASEIAPIAAPGAGDQKRLLALARSAGLDGLIDLPPYSVKSITEYYNNGYCFRTDQQMVSDLIHNYKHKWQGVGPWISSFSVEEGRESADRNGPVMQAGSLPKPPNFENWGEFGAQPALILDDILPESFEFLRWEKSPRGRIAVFHYDVSAGRSHYRVNASCGKNMPFNSLPAYQGTISIDPQTGAILRLTMQAASQKKDPIFDIAAAIEYGPVRLGQTEAILPQRSLTFMTEDPNVCLGTQGGVSSAAGGLVMVDFLPTRRYNRTLFADYQAASLIAGATPTQPAPEASTPPLTPVSNVAEEKISIADLERLLDKLSRVESKELSQITSESQRSVRAETLDELMAQSIRRLQLTERLDLNQQKELQQQFHLGPRSAAALALLADLSALRDPPSTLLVKKPALAEDEQTRLLQIARNTSTEELAHLPNFFAKRDTLHFAGELQIKPDSRGMNLLPINGASQDSGLISLKSSTNLRITYRDGREVIDKAVRIDPQGTTDSSANAAAQGQPSLDIPPGEGLKSWGEFGSELVTVLSDTQQGSVRFHHWEESPTGLLAVFRFDVPQADSHYQVSSDCGRDGHPFHAVPAYKGAISLEAETGRVVRLQIQTASEPADPITGVASVIEYGPVQIGDKTFNRPLRSLTFLTVDPVACIAANELAGRPQAPRYLPVRQLNLTTFSDYHRLGSTYRIVTGDEGSQQSNPQ
jgi:hypothetical protein